MPLQVFLIYAALVATDGFQNNAPFVFALPVIVLGWFTLWTRMPGRKRLLTAISFFTLAIALYTLALVSLFLYGVFADLYRSIPALVAAMCATILLSTSSFIVAGSVWKNGSTMRYEERSALVRFFGTFFLLICNAALLCRKSV
uniref:Uncharacterized protein n=1 Tax=Meloidogyne floridensis TaxID=298350 RepID=A0A915PE21_9BILA